jgi:NTP pyrophosphatase (non-canonical NTP hydrolase)
LLATWSSALNIEGLTRELRAFALERQWGIYHTPKNLSTALVVEAAELAEIFQWKTPEESCAAHLDASTRTKIADEVADVFLYLLMIADATGVDIETAARDKMLKNAVKHPPGKPV